MAMITTDSQKPTRQPQSRKASSLSRADRASMTTVASRLPIGTAAWGKLPQKARDRFGLCSVTSRIAPPHSPPSAKPWMNLSVTSSTGAQ